MLKITTLSIITSLLLVGCGGGGSTTNSDTPSTGTTNITGQFIDSSVEGLDYKCSSGTSGTTDSFGYFSCKQGDRVTFSINGFLLGSTTAQKLITPRTFYSDDNVSAVNMAQLLQTLDSDNNPNNGIKIDQNSSAVEALKDVNISFHQVDFDSAIVTYIGKTLVSEQNATKHMDIAIKNKKNTPSTPTALSVVGIFTHMSKEGCSSIDPSQHTYDGYSDYEDFLNAGGSVAIDYSSSLKSCSNYGGAGSCTVQDYANVGQNVSGNGSCIQVVTFPHAPDDTNPGTTDKTAPSLSATFSGDYNLAYAGNGNYIKLDNNKISLNNIEKQTKVWEYTFTESISDLSIVKISKDALVTKAWSSSYGKEIIKFINKQDGSEISSLQLETLGSINLNDDDTVMIQSNGNQRRLIATDGTILLSLDNITSHAFNKDMIVFNDHYTEKKLKAYDFKANLLWESNTSCDNIVMDENSLYCENFVTADSGASQSKLSKIDLRDGKIVTEATFPKFSILSTDDFHQTDSALFVNINGWNDDGTARSSFVKINKSNLTQAWSINSYNIADIDPRKGLIYTYVYGILNAYNTSNGTKAFEYNIPNLKSQSIIWLKVNDDSSIVTQQAVNDSSNPYKYDLLTY